MSLGQVYLFIQPIEDRKPVWKQCVVFLFFYNSALKWHTSPLITAFRLAVQMKKHLLCYCSTTLRQMSCSITWRVNLDLTVWELSQPDSSPSHMGQSLSANDSCRSPNLHSARHMLSWTALHSFHVAANSCLTVHSHKQQSGPQQRIVLEILD